MVEESAYTMIGLALLKIWVMALLPCHFSACVWYYIGYESYHTVGQNGVAESWLNQIPADVQSMIPTPGESPKGWDGLDLYQVSAYFVLVTMTTVGYGDFSPRTRTERWFCMILLFESMVVFSTFVGLMNSMLLEIYAASSFGRQRLIQLAEYMRWRNVTGDLKHSIIDHMKHIWEENRSHLQYESELCRDLSPNLRTNLMWSVFGPVLAQAPFLCWMNQTALRELCFFASTRIMESGDVVFSVGEIVDTLFCVTLGRIKTFRPRWAREMTGVDRDDMELNRCFNVGYSSSKDDRQLTSQQFRVSRMKRDSTRIQLSGFNKWFDWLYLVSADGYRGAAKEESDTMLDHGKQYFKQLWAQSREVQRDFDFWKSGPNFSPTACKSQTIDAQILDAPGFLGESVLWNIGLDRSPGGGQAQHSCICLTRSEFVTVERKRVADVAARYPSLVSNFEFMRQQVFLDVEKQETRYHGRKILSAMRAHVARRKALKGDDKTPASAQFVPPPPDCLPPAAMLQNRNAGPWVAWALAGPELPVRETLPGSCVDEKAGP
mmetsp:Transcript_74674/g.199198  ORF Transcript_74674/g.199198 Transcript_74674/m.199198 type:complete len:548 (-) Transcript_74674:139-1782(-)